MRQIGGAIGGKTASPYGPATPPDVRIARLAGRQHAVVGRRQLLAAGIGEDAIRHRVRTGRLHPLYRGVYLVGHQLLLPNSRHMAAVLACGPRAFASHRTAAALLGLRPSPSGDPEVTVVRAGGRLRHGITVHATRSLAAAEAGMCKRIPCTSPARTLVDLAAVLDRRRLRRALERSVELRILDGRAMDASLARSRGRRGVGILRELLAALRGDPAPARTEIERRFLDLVRDGGLPLPVVNAYVGPYEVDFHWPEARLVVETDGRETHDTPHQFDEDRRRDLELTLAGWHVVRIGWRQLVHSPGRVAALLRSRLG